MYDFFQTVAIADLPDRQLTDADLEPPNAKAARCALTLEERGHTLPPCYTSVTPAEQRALAAAAAFGSRWVAEHPWRPTPWLVAVNECGTPKLVCTTLRRTMLPHPELHDLPGVCRLLAEFFTYEPPQRAGAPPPQLASPTATLEWQVGGRWVALERS